VGGLHLLPNILRERRCGKDREVAVSEQNQKSKASLVETILNRYNSHVRNKGKFKRGARNERKGQSTRTKIAAWALFD
jgi:hypothetical protein